MKPALIPDDTIMKPEEVAAWLKVKRRQLDRLGVPCIVFATDVVDENGASKKTVHKKTVRYLRADVLAWLQRQRKAS